MINTDYAKSTVEVSANGAVQIPFPWGSPLLGSVKVTMGEFETPVPEAGYSVSPNPPLNGGTVTILESFNNLQEHPTIYTVHRVTPLRQPDVYTDRQQISSKTLEGSLDNLERQIQELDANQLNIEVLNESVANVMSALDAEAQARQSGDTLLDGKITTNQSAANGRIDALTTRVAAEETARAAGDIALGTRITTETGTLRDRIAAEEAARAGGDNTLQAAITTEQTARQQGDINLQTNITNEATARATADTNLSALITAEQTARSTADDAINIRVAQNKARIEGLEKLGHHVGTFDTRADVPNTVTGFPNGITINDFIRVRADETQEGALTQYVADVIDASGNITWDFDFALPADADKQDKVPSATPGNFAAWDAAGQTLDSGYRPSSFATPAMVANATVATADTLDGYHANYFATKVELETLDNMHLALAGGSMTGNISMAGHYVTGLNAPQEGCGAATKGYVDAADLVLEGGLDSLEDRVGIIETGFLARSGGTMTGVLNMGNMVLAGVRDNPQYDDEAINRKYVDDAVAALTGVQGGYLPLTGGTMRGNINANGFRVTGAPLPVLNSELTNKRYVDERTTNLVDPTKLPLAGGVMGGDIDLNSNRITGVPTPVLGNHVVNKEYADGLAQQIGGPRYETERLVAPGTVGWTADLNGYVKAAFSGAGQPLVSASITINGYVMDKVTDANVTQWTSAAYLVLAGDTVTVACGNSSLESTSGIYHYALRPVQAVVGVTAHPQLTARDAENSHPIAAITNLTARLSALDTGLAAIPGAVNSQILAATACFTAAQQAQDVKINATLFARANSVTFARGIGALTEVPVSTVPDIQGGLITPQARMTMLADPQGTIGYFVNFKDTVTMNVRTLCTSFMGVDVPVRLGNVATHADLPATLTAATTLWGRTARIDDYAYVEADETMDGALVEWYIKAIGADDSLTWGDPLAINTSTYQAQSAVSDAGKLLTGNATGGGFGTSVSIDGTLSGTGVPQTGLVKASLDSLSSLIVDKADSADLAAGLSLKADESSVVSRLAQKANLAALDSYYTKAQMDAALANKAFLSDLTVYAPLASPALTGTPTVPAPAAGTYNNQISTTKYVQDVAQWYSDNIDQPRVEVLDTDDSTTPLAPGHLRLITGASGGGGGGGGAYGMFSVSFMIRPGTISSDMLVGANDIFTTIAGPDFPNGVKIVKRAGGTLQYFLGRSDGTSNPLGFLPFSELPLYPIIQVSARGEQGAICGEVIAGANVGAGTNEVARVGFRNYLGGAPATSGVCVTIFYA